MSPFKKKLRFDYLQLFGLSSIVLIYFYFCFFAHPIGDDFVNSSSVIKNGILPTCNQLYFGWSGRYSSNLLLSVNPIVFGSFLGYQLALLFILFHFIGSVYWLCKLLYKAIHPLQIWILTLLISLVYLTVLPTISEGIYWFGASATYQVANNLFLNYFGLILLNKRTKKSSLIFKVNSVILLGLALIIIGFNEVILVYLLCFNFLYFGMKLLKKEDIPLSVFMVAIPIIGAAFAVFAPGNSVRSSFFDNNHDLLNSIGMSIAQTGRFSLKWLLSPSMILVSILFIAQFDSIKNKIPLLKRAMTLDLKFTIPLLFLPIFVAAILPYWSTGILGQHRTMNAAWLVFLMLWFINLSVIAKAITSTIESKLNWISFHKNKFASLLYISFLATGNGFYLFSDLLQNKQFAFDAEMKAREKELLVEKPIYYFNILKNPSETLMVYDLSEKSDNYINRSYTYYFNRKDAQIFGVKN